MAMRPDVRRHALVVIVFSLAQWFFMRYILANELFNMTTNQRILFFCVSSLVGGSTGKISVYLTSTQNGAVIVEELSRGTAYGR